MGGAPVFDIPTTVWRSKRSSCSLVHMRLRVLVVGIMIIAACLLLGVAVADADVRAFSTRTGLEDTAFVTLTSTSRPSALIPDGKHGVYVVGHVTVGGRALSIVHVQADGKVSPSFRASIGPGEILSGAVRGNELALLGRFRRIDGQPRRGIAILDARSGRLRNWAPTLPGRRLVRAIAASCSRRHALVAEPWVRSRDGETGKLSPSGSITSRLGNAMISCRRSPRGMARFWPRDPSTEHVLRLTPADGHARLAGGTSGGVKFQTVGGRLLYSVEGDYAAVREWLQRALRPKRRDHPDPARSRAQHGRSSSPPSQSMLARAIPTRHDLCVFTSRHADSRFQASDPTYADRIPSTAWSSSVATSSSLRGSSRESDRCHRSCSILESAHRPRAGGSLMPPASARRLERCGRRLVRRSCHVNDSGFTCDTQEGHGDVGTSSIQAPSSSTRPLCGQR